MRKRRKVLTSGRFAGKTVTLSSTNQVDTYWEIADHFMSAIFDLDPGDYLITDESDVLDFTSIDESDTSGIWRRIEAVYGVALSDVNSGRLVKIFEAIASRRRLQ
jgi:hypothetical protein